MTDRKTNIGTDGAKVRLLFGLIFVFFSLVLPILLIGLETARAWRLLLVPPAWAAVLFLLQARARLCFFLACQGLANFGEGTQPAPDADVDALRRRGIVMALWSLAAALAYTAAVLALPLPRLADYVPY